MRTAEEMYNYCLENNTGRGRSHRWGRKHFRVIENMLQPDEVAHVCFIGLHNYTSAVSHEYHYAYAITNKRLLMGHKKLIGQNFKAVFLENLNDIGISTGVFKHNLTIDTLKEYIAINLKGKARTENTYHLSHNYIDKIREGEPAVAKSDALGQIQKAHDMLEQGIITEKEFEAMKTELLK